ncbi:MULTISPECIES: alpha/beta hydrolase [unclassified Streptomyces]|uniref:alpha/beta hydrolase n=1 Tax=Streptomyces sp. SYP-A7185 TaxID=3040076 RepID=UPI0038F6FB00
MSIEEAEPVQWQLAEVASPGIAQRVSVVKAEDIPYFPGANRLQTLNIYLPRTPRTLELVGTAAERLPAAGPDVAAPRYHVHIHGGAWRDPQLASSSIEPTVAHAFSGSSPPISAVASLNYRISQFPTHPLLPYDAVQDNHSDPAREATHPNHVSDVLHGLALLRSFGLTDRSYILSGHSCGACIAFQAILQAPLHHGLDLPDAPCPAALLGLNGLYDLPELTDGLGASHAHLQQEYRTLLTHAFTADKKTWALASPARFDPADIAQRIREGKAPRLVVLDQSPQDLLVPMNQKERLEANLRRVEGIHIVEGHRNSGGHAAPWERGDMIWESLQDILRLVHSDASR